MDLDTAGIGAGGGLLGALLTYLGIQGRVSRLEKTVRFHDTCVEIHRSTDLRLASMEKKQDQILDILLKRSKT